MPCPRHKALSSCASQLFCCFDARNAWPLVLRGDPFVCMRVLHTGFQFSRSAHTAYKNWIRANWLTCAWCLYVIWLLCALYSSSYHSVCPILIKVHHYHEFTLPHSRDVSISIFVQCTSNAHHPCSAAQNAPWVCMTYPHCMHTLPCCALLAVSMMIPDLCASSSTRLRLARIIYIYIYTYTVYINIYAVYIRYSWPGFHEIHGHIRRMNIRLWPTLNVLHSILCGVLCKHIFNVDCVVWWV